MSRGDAKRVHDDTMATINSALNILNKFPNGDDGLNKLNISGSITNPLEILMIYLKSFWGYPQIINIIGDFLTLAIEPLEWAVKSVLILNFKNLLTCSLNPIIPDDILKNGVCFSLDSIDLMGLMNINPMDKHKGQLYYFGVWDTLGTHTNPKDDKDKRDTTIVYGSTVSFYGIQRAEDLLRSNDMNAWFWYAKHKSMERLIWHAKNPKYKSSERYGFKNDSGSYLIPRYLPFYSVQSPTEADNKDGAERYHTFRTGSWEDIPKGKNGKLQLFYQTSPVVIDVTVDENNDTGKVKVIEQKTSLLQTDDFNTLVSAQLSANNHNPNIVDSYLPLLRKNKLRYTDSNNGKVKTKKIDWKIQKLEQEIRNEYEDSFQKCKNGGFLKEKKRHGIATIEYNSLGADATDFCNQPLSLKIPYNNLIHVFVGNTRPEGVDRTALYENKSPEARINYLRNEINDLISKINKANDKKDKLDKSIKKLETKTTSSNDTANTNTPTTETNPTNTNDNDKNKDIGKKIDDKKKQIKAITQQIEKYTDDKNKKIEEVKKLTADQAAIEDEYRNLYRGCATCKYFGYTQNYYYKRFIMEFNTDYVWSVDLFDSRTLLAQLIDSCLNFTSIDFGLSYEHTVVKELVSDMVEKAIIGESFEVDDCFFTFNNKEYNERLNKAELIRRGVYVDKNNNPGPTINPDVVADALNNIDSSASKSEMKTQIVGAINTIAAEVTEVPLEWQGQNSLSADSNILHPKDMLNDFITNLLKNLSTVVIMSVLSPKLYVLIAMNLEMVGQDSDFRIEDFIEKFKKMISELVQEVVKHVMQFLIKKIMEYVGELAASLSTTLVLESVEYYRRMVMQIIEACNFNTSDMLADFKIDQVSHADILAPQMQPPSTC